MKRERQWEMVLQRDPAGEGRFVYGVRTTGIYCRPTCPSRRPKPESVEFFSGPADAERAGYRACQRCRPASASAQAQAIAAACKFIDKQVRDGESVTLEALGKYVGMSPYHLQRLFKRHLGISPREYQATKRQERMREQLGGSKTVTDAIYDAGYGSSSRFYEADAQQLGMSPSDYRKHGAGTRIRFTIFDSRIGKGLIATTDRGVASITFGDDPMQLEEGLRGEFQLATIERDDQNLQELVKAIQEHLSGTRRTLEIPLDVQATAFQRRVWEMLRTIPYGETRSYAEVAKRLGNPKATRAVARACATNPVALAVPCHRVVASNGALAGYRWGKQRKAALLQQESQTH